ncbi:TIGR02117 family protein [Sphingomonas sp.]|uniref:TIGR02117 family protein n=1 Tax=Sphingomonas sp. TaxID=28214 RepID=UPI001ED58191|nr:TIGR02117 family protein [Sphingomonas sp.]MBX3593222.1 TIGR02117 family protein [Sphingomonas sp.]
MARKPAGSAIAVLLLLLATPVFGYVAAGLAGGVIPANGGWTAPGRGVRIYVEDNGIHTGIVLPVRAAGVAWDDLPAPGDVRDPRHARHGWRSFGWGDRAFYLRTPGWRDVRVATVLRAAIGSSDTLMHVGFVSEPGVGPSVRAVTVRPAEYRRLAAFIRASFQADGSAPARAIPGYGASDAFYVANGRYSALRTCNAWTGEAFRAAGLKMGVWTPFPWTVMRWLPDPTNM